jgi:hypothetical protein
MQTGRNCSINYNTGSYGTPTWTELGRASSPSRSQSRPTSRKTYREATTSKNVTGLLDYGISFQYVAKDAGVSDTVLTAILASLRSGTTMDIAMLDDDAGTSGATGIRGPFVVSECNRSEDDEDAVVYDVTLVEVEDSTNSAETAAYTIS